MFYASTIRAPMCPKRLIAAVALLTCVCIATTEAQAQTNVCDSNATFTQAKRMIAGKQFEAAGRLLDRFRDCSSIVPLEKFQLGWLYGGSRRFQDALAVFQAVPHNVPDPLTHDYAVALSEFELGRYRQSADLLKPLQQSGKADSKTVNLLAVSYSKLNLYRDAYDVLSQDIQRGRPGMTTYLNLVTVCTEGGDLAAAAKVAENAAGLFPESPDVWIVDGAAQTVLGHFDEARQKFSTATKLAPARADARFFLALVDYKQNKFSDAISVLQQAVREGIADSDVHYLMAECLLKNGTDNAQRSLAELDSAIALNAKSVAARTLRGKLLLDSGHPAAAITDLEIARVQDPRSRPVLYNLARAYQANGRTAEAQALFRKYRSEGETTSDSVAGARLSQALTGANHEGAD
jgi:tetratricopeptide (TPR) repeat protein